MNIMCFIEVAMLDSLMTLYRGTVETVSSRHTDVVCPHVSISGCVNISN
jgi:hypothetical protein